MLCIIHYVLRCDVEVIIRACNSSKEKLEIVYSRISSLRRVLTELESVCVMVEMHNRFRWNSFRLFLAQNEMSIYNITKHNADFGYFGMFEPQSILLNADFDYFLTF